MIADDGHDGTRGNVLATFYRLADQVGTTRGLGSNIGTWLQKCMSLPYGEGHCISNQFGFFFTGMRRDGTFNTDYFAARYYASRMGSWMSPDWSAKEEPVPYAKLGDPQTLNLYGYVQNNPLTVVDPDGHAEQGNPCSDGKTCPNVHNLGGAADSVATAHAALVNAQPQAGPDVKGAAPGADAGGQGVYFSRGGRGKGERGQAGSRHGTPNPGKKVRPDPKKPGNILVRDPHTGKSASIPDPSAQPATPQPERISKPGKQSIQERVGEWMNDQVQSMKDQLNKMPGGSQYVPPPVLPLPPILGTP